MTELDQIKQEVELKQKWLTEHWILSDAVRYTSQKNVYLGYDEYIGGHNHGRKTSVSPELAKLLNATLNQALEDFEKLGYDGWLEKNERKEKQNETITTNI